MIINGNPAGNVGFWSKHLLRDDTNELVEVKEITGLLAEDLPSALREMEAIADQSRCEGNFMYQANINPLANEHLTPEQWIEAVDTLEKNLGLEGHQRVVVEHVKEGRQHYHVIWNRVDVDTLRVVDMGGNWHIHSATSRELEARFDLTPTPTPEQGVEKQPVPELWEIRAAERSGIDRAALKAELTDLWKQSDSGQAFVAAVEQRGYIVAQGDRRDFCIVDQAGDAHSLARRLDGVNTKQVRERMADVDRESLPSVTEARETQRAIAREHAPLSRAAGEIRLAWSLSNSAEGFAAALDRNGMTLARVDGNEAAASLRAQAFAKELGNYAPRYAEGEIVVVNSFGGVQRLDDRTTGEGRAEITKALGTIDHAALLNVTDARAVMKEVARREFYEQFQAGRDLTPTEQRIQALQQESATAGAFSAALGREGLTIARVDGAGIEGLARDQRAAFVVDEKVFHVPTLAEGELVAVNCYGGVHRLNPFKLDIEGIETALTSADRAVPMLGVVRDEIAEARGEQGTGYAVQNLMYWPDQGHRTGGPSAGGVQTWQEGAKFEDIGIESIDPHDATVGSAFMVVDTAGRVAGGLSNFVCGLLAGGRPRQPANDHSFAGQMEQKIANRRALAAIENIRNSLARGERLSTSDISNLTPSHLENIRLKGDDYLRSLVDSNERNRPREIDWGRFKER